MKRRNLTSNRFVFSSRARHASPLQGVPSVGSWASPLLGLLLLAVFIGGAGAAAAAADAASVQVVDARPFPELTEAFRKGSEGWVGGDGAYSVRLNENATMWTFGDTFIGKIEGNKRLPGCVMINNTAAVQKLSASIEPLDFKWMKKGRKDASLWVARAKEAYFWPADGIAIDGKLYVFLHEIRPDKSKPEPFQFRMVADHLVRVDNPLDEPNNWKMTYVSLGNDAEKLSYATATIRYGDYVYLYCSYGTARKGLDAHPAILARIPVYALQSLDLKQIEYYCKTASKPEWLKNPEDPVILFPDAAPEMTVTQVDGVSGFVVVYMPPLSKEIMLRQAPNPEGPWGEQIKLYDCPEKDDSVLLYSAKAHQELAREEGELIVTYCRNTKEFETHFEDAGVYFPQAVKIKLK